MTDPTRDAGAAPDPADEAAWDAVRARWGDPLAHRAYLDGCLDLAALARAGARYREALAAEPGDAVAAAGRDEVVRRASIVGLASVPRARPASRWLTGGEPSWVKWALLALVAGPLLLAALRLLGRFPGGRP